MADLEAMVQALDARVQALERENAGYRAFIARLREDPTMRSIEGGPFTLHWPLRIVREGREYGIVRLSGGGLGTVSADDIRSGWSDA